MEKSFDELIAFLLGEIAVKEARGASLSEIDGLVKSFYDTARHEARTPSENSSSPLTRVSSGDAQHVDQAFILKVWKWLARHPDISIGAKKRFNKQPLADFWTRSDVAESTLKRSSDAAPRLFLTSKDRIHQAIFGHAQQSSKIHGKETALLSQIAASGRNGILQGELGRLTGQDKRSVPKRTDALRDKGFIVKQTVYIKGTKTSRLILRKYVAESGDVGTEAVSREGSPTPTIQEPRKVRDVVDKIIGCLAAETRVEIDDVADQVDMVGDAHRRVLMKIVRLMERSGLLKRVRMVLGPAAQSGDLKTYVQFLRHPTDLDLQPLEETAISFDTPVEELVVNEATRVSPPVCKDRSQTPEQESMRAQWNPDRGIANMLSDATIMAGASGLSNISARNLITGPFVRRTLESLLTRLSYQGIVSQPSHLRHLGIIRATKLVGGILEYAHFSQGALPKAVRAKGVDFDSIPGAKIFLSYENDERYRGLAQASDSANFRADHFSLPETQDTSSLANGAIATLTELITMTSASSIVPRAGEPQIVQNSLGEETLDRIGADESPVRERPSSKKARSVHVRANHEDKVSGRPRKFLRGTEKFWQYHFWKMRREAHGASDKLRTKDGTMSDPAGLALFNSRPEEFDETVLKARSEGLPLPAHTKDISEEWMRRARHVMDRKGSGAYVTPRGILIGKVRFTSQLLIVRSDRLQSLDFSNKYVPRFRFLTSSAAHSYSLTQTQQDLLSPRKKVTGKAKGIPRSGRKKVGRKPATHGPRLGVFLETATASPSPTSKEPTKLQSNQPLTASEYQQLMDDTESESESVQRPISKATTTFTQVTRSSRAISASTHRSASQHQNNPQVPSPPGAISSGSATVPNTKSKDKLTQKVAEAVQDVAVEVGLHDAISGPTRTDKSSENHGGRPNGQSKQLRKVGVGELEDQTSREKTKFGISRDQDLGEVRDHLATPTKPKPGLEAPTTDATLANQATIGTSHVEDGEHQLSAPHQASSLREPLILGKPVGQSEEILSGMTPAFSPTTRADRAEQVDSEPPRLESEPLRPTGAELSRISKRKHLELESDEDAASPSAPSRQKPIIPRQSQSQSSKLCRKIVVELIMLANGAAPNDHITFRRVMTNRWQAEGGGDRPERKLVNNNVKTLSNHGKVQLIGFSYRGKDGVVVKKSILALPGIAPTGQLIQDLKRKIIDADPTDYVPPEWQAETLPTLNMAGNIRSRGATEGQFERPPIQELPARFQTVPEPEKESGVSETPAPKRKRRQRRLTASSESTTSSPRSARSRETTKPPEFGDALSVYGSPSTTSFLTLKVPRLGELSQVHTFNANLEEPEWKKSLRREAQDSGTESDIPEAQTSETESDNLGRLPAPPIRFNSDATSFNATALPTPVEKRRSGLRGGFKRKAKGKHFDPITHEVIPEDAAPTLPESLLAILDAQQAHSPILKMDPGAAEEDRFATEVEMVAAWETRCETEIYGNTVGWTFINHTVSTQPLTCPIAFWLLVDVHRHGVLTLSPSLGSDSWPPFVNALDEANRQDLVSLGDQDHSPGVSQARRKSRENTGIRRKRKLSPMEPDTQTRPAAKRARKRRANSFVSDDTQSDGEFAPPSHQSQEKTRKLEASRLLKKMSKKEIDRVATTLTCVRILSGGIDMTIDWSIIKPLLPELLQTTVLLEECWVVIQETRKSDVDNMTGSFQEHYIEALEAGKVPMVNLDNPTSTDWQAIISWALQNIGHDADKQKSAALPATSAEFFAKHRLKLDETPSLRDTFRPVHPAKKIHKDKREDLHRATIFGISLISTPSTSTTASTAQIRSLILSIILCPEPQYSQPLAAAKWTSLAPTEISREALVRPAFQGLLETDKLITLRSGVQNSTGPRKYKPTSKFWDLFGEKNCIVTAAMLRDAGRYKTQVLDKVFASGGAVALAKEARVASGEMLAVMQLMGMGVVEIRAGKDIPNSRYGVEWERVGYETRKLGKESFSFGVGMGVKEGYVFGDGGGKRAAVDVPRGDSSRAAMTPIWVDVYGEVVEEVWEMVLGTALGIVSSRPGVSAEEISKSLGGAVGAWELDLLLAWAEKSGFTEKTRSGKGWQTRDWWWLCLASGSIDEVV